MPIDRPGWPKEIRKPTVLANFRPTAEERAFRIRPQPNRDKRPGMSPEHLELIRRLPCTVCFETVSVHPHHLRHGDARAERGFGLKCTDRYCIPLCYMHHEDCHRYGARREREWFDSFGFSAVNLAAALWANRGNYATMFTVLKAHKQAAHRLMAERLAAVKRTSSRRALESR